MALIRTFTGHTAPVLAAVFMPGNRFILSASGDCTAKLWDTDQDEAVRTFDFPEPLTTLALRHDGLAVVGDKRGRVTLWDVTTGEIRTAVRDSGWRCAILNSCSDRRLGCGRWRGCLAHGLSGPSLRESENDFSSPHGIQMQWPYIRCTT